MVREAVKLWEDEELPVCLLSPKCELQHRLTACEWFGRLLSHHRKSLLAVRDVCMVCLWHSNQDEGRREACQTG
jgi:hypothetical protein